VKFRVKVTSSGADHRILAEADAIPLILPDERPDRETLSSR